LRSTAATSGGCWPGSFPSHSSPATPAPQARSPQISLRHPATGIPFGPFRAVSGHFDPCGRNRPIVPNRTAVIPSPSRANPLRTRPPVIDPPPAASPTTILQVRKASPQPSAGHPSQSDHPALNPAPQTFGRSLTDRRARTRRQTTRHFFSPAMIPGCATPTGIPSAPQIEHRRRPDILSPSAAIPGATPTGIPSAPTD